jgi:Na+/H+ antiporter NhaC
MDTMIRQIALVSTSMILFVLFWFVFIVLGALEVDTNLQYFASFLVTLIFAPSTWRFSLREARLQNGDSDADRKN